jgi:hypothetical protein
LGADDVGAVGPELVGAPHAAANARSTTSRFIERLYDTQMDRSRRCRLDRRAGRAMNVFRA